MNEILRLFSPVLKGHIERFLQLHQGNLEEIRLRIQKPIELNFYNHSKLIDHALFTQEEKMFFLRQLSEHSLYRMEEQFKHGFMTLEGGHRIGFAGEVVIHEGKEKINEATFFNIRIARSIDHIARPLIPYIRKNNQYKNTLIFGAPQTGKTTILRNIAKNLSTNGMKVGIIDERSEIAAAKNGVPQLNVGVRTDVMDNCAKQIGMMMMIRSMSPQILFVDEIGSYEDVQAISEATRTGVTIICTAHSNSMNDLIQRPQLKQLIDTAIFQRFLYVSRREHGHFHIEVMDKQYEKIYTTTVWKR